MHQTQIQKTVQFYGDEIIAVQDGESGVIYVPVGRLCDNLGVNRRNQMDRLRDNELLSDGLATVTVATGGGPQATECLRLDLIPLWLTTINAGRVKAAVADKLRRYQREAASVLWNAFRHDIMPPESLVEQARPRSGAELALEIATAIQHLAQQQLEIEQQVERVHGRMDGMARFLSQFADRTDARLASLELSLAPQSAITGEQAAELALAVKAVGTALSGTQRAQNGYAVVYGELYRRYRVSSYKNLPRRSYEEVLAWLHAWHAELTAEDAQSTNST